MTKYNPRGHFVKVPKEIIYTNELNTYEKVIFIFLASFKHAYPTKTQLARSIGVKDPRVVSRSINRLKEMGLITWRRGFQGRSNLYRIQPQPLWLISAESLRLDSDDPLEALAEVEQFTTQSEEA